MNTETDLTPKEVKVMIVEAARQHMPVPAEWWAILQGNCTQCGEPIVCAVCAGRKGWRKQKGKITHKQRQEWGGLGGRPRKDGRPPQPRTEVTCENRIDRS